MKIPGISGLKQSVPFKKAHWPGLDEREYRISQGHDDDALIADAEVVAAAAEERSCTARCSPRRRYWS